MIDKGFIKNLKEFFDDRMIFRKKPLNFMGHCNPEEQELVRLYFQYKIFKWTKWLVFATWALAIGTILVLIFK